MRKILLLILITMSLQSRAQTGTPGFDTTKVNRMFLRELIKIPVENEFARQVIINQIDSLTSASSDSLLLTVADRYKSNLLLLKFNDKKAKPVSSLSKADLKGFEIKEDKFQNSAFIIPRIGNEFTPYIAIRDGNMNLRIKVQYHGEDWIFFDNVIVLTESGRYSFVPNEAARDVSTRYVYEKTDTVVDDNILETLKAVATSPSVEYRLSGKYKLDAKLTAKQIAYIKATLELYEKLKI